MPSSLDLCLGVSTLPKVSLSFESWPGMHIVHSETFMSKLVASYFGETFTFFSNAIRERHPDILFDMNNQRFIRDKYLTQIVGII